MHIAATCLVALMVASAGLLQVKAGQCNKKDFTNLGEMPYDPADRSNYQNVFYYGNLEVINATETYQLKCAVS